MGTQTDHLVGRTEELGLLARALAELEPGRSIAILLVGEPGIGKTRLLTDFGARAAARARARRSPLGGSGFDRAARSASAATALRAGLAGARDPPASRARATVRGARAGLTRRADHAHRARSAQRRGGSRATRR